MLDHDVSAHMCTGVHSLFPKVVKIWASINFPTPERWSCGWTGLLKFYESVILGT